MKSIPDRFMKNIFIILPVLFISIIIESYGGNDRELYAVGRVPEKYSRREIRKENVELMVQTMHSRNISFAVFSPDSRTIITGSKDNTLRIWNNYGKLIKRIEGFSGAVLDAVFNPDGSSFVTSDSPSEYVDRLNITFKLWYIDGSLIAEMKGGLKGDARAGFSAGGNRIITWSRGDNRIFVWDRSGTRVLALPVKEPYIRNAGISPDGKYVLATTSHADSAGLWDMKKAMAGNNNNAYLWDMKGKMTVLKHPGFVFRAAFDPRGTYIATGSHDGNIRMWSFNGACVKTIKGFEYDFKNNKYEETDPFISPDGNHIISIARDGNALRLWNVKSGKMISLNHSEKSPAPKSTAGLNSIWDEIEKEEKRQEKLPDKPEGERRIFNFSFSPDGNRIAGAFHDKLILWNINGAMTDVFTGGIEKHNNSQILFTGDGKRILAWGGPLDPDKELKPLISLWDIERKKETLLNNGIQYRDYLDFDRYSRVNTSPDGRFVYAYGGLSVFLWDGTGRFLNSLGEQVIRKFGLLMSADREHFLSQENTEVIGDLYKTRYWGVNGKLIGRYDSSHEGEFHGSGFSGSEATTSDGRHIAVLNRGMDVITVRSGEGKPDRTITSKDDKIGRIALSPDGKYVAGMIWRKDTLRIWGDDGRPVLALDEPVTAWINNNSFSPDSSMTALGFRDSIRIYGMDGKLVRSFKSDRTSNVQFAPHGGFIISTEQAKPGRSSVHKIYDLKGNAKAVLTDWGSFVDMALTPKGDKIIICYSLSLHLLDRAGNLLKSKNFSTKNICDYEITAADFSGGMVYAAARSQCGYKSRLLVFDRDLNIVKSTIFEGHTSYVQNHIIDPSKNLLISSSSDGTIKYWSMENGKCIATLVGYGYEENKGIIYTPDYYYRMSGDSSNIIAFVKGNRAYGFEQFDLRYNRPDIVLERVYPGKGRPKQVQEEIDRYRRYWQYRLRQNGFTEEEMSGNSALHAPEIFDIMINGVKADTAEKNIRETTAEISFKIRDEKGSDKNIIGYKIFVNGVPLHGEFVKRFSEPGPVKEVTENITLSSTSDAYGNPGDNRVEISGFTGDGIESKREVINLNHEVKGAGKGDLYIVSLGIDDYRRARGLESLAYAVNDARDIVAAFSETGRGKYGKVVPMLYTNEMISRDIIREIKEKLSGTTVNDTVIFFLAGHGIRAATSLEDSKNIARYFNMEQAIGGNTLSGDSVNVYYYMTADSDAEKPWVKGIPMEALRLSIDGIPARQKILLIDTCQSGENPMLSGIPATNKNLEKVRQRRGSMVGKERVRGFTLVHHGKVDDGSIINTAAWALDMKEMSEMFPELRRGTGTIEISAATGVQSALESGEWKNGAFTYAVKEALLNGKGRDKQGRITARSLRKYILDRVEEITGGDQTPMVCRDIAGRDFELTGK